MTNTIEKIIHPLQVLPSGDVLKLIEFKIKGREAGPTLHIQANVHGAEVQGNALILKLLQFFENHPIKGEISLFPCANPQAMNHKVGEYTQGRFNPVTGDNWNRLYFDVFKSKENQDKLTELCKKVKSRPQDEMAQSFKMFLDFLIDDQISLNKEYGISENSKLFLFLQKKAAHADIVLDLHTGPKATYYLYAPEYLQAEAPELGVKHTLIVPHLFAGAMDESTFCPWTTFKEFLAKEHIDFKIPFSSYTVELESEEVFSLQNAEVALAKMISYLSYKKILPEKFHAPTVEKQYWAPLKNFKTYYAPTGGLVDFKLRPGDHFQSGDLLATLVQIRSYPQVETPILAVKKGILINHATTSILKEGMTLFQVLENVDVF